MYDLEKAKCIIYRGGTSRGLFFHSKDIPEELDKRRDMFLRIMGSPDIRQIDGLGGATSHTSKVAVISKSKEDGIDIEYDFYQVGIENPIVSRHGMCGNLLAAAGLFAVDEGLVSAEEPTTVVAVRNINTGKRFLVHIPVKNGQSVTQGAYKIDGVARSGACILEEFLDPAGAVTGKLLPTGKPSEHIRIENSIYKVSIVDAANPTVFMLMKDLKITGAEKPSELNSKPEFLDLLELIRGEAARLCGFVSTVDQARAESPNLPLLALVGSPLPYISLYGQLVETFNFDIRLLMLSLQRFHQSIALTTSICLAVAALITDSVVNEIYKPTMDNTKIRIGHPSGIIQVDVELGEGSPRGLPYISKVVVSRTARRLMEGVAYYPKS